jgi:glycosyltransferase involved in cell wall biosynthesis
VSAATAAGSRIRPSICFVAHNAYGSLTGSNEQHAGGIERQQATMAKWLVGHGWGVSMVTWREPGDIVNSVDGVDVVPMCGRADGLPGARFLHPRWTSLVDALRRADADLYYYNCGDLGLGQVVLWAKRRRRPTIFSVASDPDCDRSLPALSSLRERVLYRYGLRNCDQVVVQSEKQRSLLADGWSRSSTILPMPCAGFHRDRAAVRRDGRRLRVLWVGRLNPEKRPEWLLEIARRMPETDFTIVGGSNRRSGFARSIQSRAEDLPNVSMAGRVPYARMEQFYGESDVLCLTSVYEGFPNVFLEAWSVGIPVVTTCDPDGLVESRGLGRRVGDVDGFVSVLCALERDEASRAAMSESAQRYFRENHGLDVAMGGFEALLSELQYRRYGKS